MQSAIYLKQFQVILTALVLLSQTAQEDAASLWVATLTADPVVQMHLLLEGIGILTVVLLLLSFAHGVARLCRC